METRAHLSQALSVWKGLCFFYAGIIIVTIAHRPVRAADTTSFGLYVYPDRTVLTVYSPGPWGSGDSVAFLPHMTGANPYFGRTEWERVRDAYAAARLNPCLTDSCMEGAGTALDAFQSCEHIPFIYSSRSMSEYDSVVIAFPYSPGLTVFHLSGSSWQPLDTRVRADSTQTTARVTENGFYILLRLVPQPFAFDEYLSSFPNPFDPRSGNCTIAYMLEYDSDTEIRIFTRTGEAVYRATYGAGGNGGRGNGDGYYLNQVAWDGRNMQGRLVEPGGYLCRLIVKDRYARTWKIGVRR